MKNTKYLIAGLFLSNIYSAMAISAPAQTSSGTSQLATDLYNRNKDLGRDNDNVTEDADAKINEDGLNPRPPETDKSKILVGTSANASGYGENVGDSDFCYSNVLIDGKKITTCANRRVIGTSGEGSVSGSSYSVDENGFYRATDPVEFDQGTSGYSKYFYRYWLPESNANVDSDNLSVQDLEEESHWSSAYPLVCYDEFSRANFESDIANARTKGSNQEEKDNNAAFVAGNYFGDRGSRRAQITKDEGNAYRYNGTYIVKAKVKPDDGYADGYLGGDYVAGETYQVLPVNSWSTNSSRVCLDPNFNYANLREGQNDGESTSAVIRYLKDLSKISSEALLDENFKQIKLPCGMFSSTTYPKGYKKSYDIEGNTITSCASDRIRLTKDKSGNELYTRYKIYLPTGQTTFETTANHYLNIRSCIHCDYVNNHCREIIESVLSKHNCVNASCAPASLESAIRDLRNSTSFEIENGVYTNKEGKSYQQGLQCVGANNCLTQIEGIIRAKGIITD